MNLLKSICLSSVLLTAAEFRICAAPLRTDINPAMQYYQAFLVAPDLPASDSDSLFSNGTLGQPLAPHVGELLPRYENQLKLMRQAAHSTVPCDWGIDMSPGPATLLPHLGRAKRIVQAARLDAKWAAQTGRAADAREDLVAALALARNTGQDGTLIGALVQVAAENLVCSAVADCFGQFPPETLNQLIEGFDAAPTRRTMASCVATEKAFFHDWLVDVVLDAQKQSGEPAKAMERIHEVLGTMENSEEGQPSQGGARWEKLMRASGGTPEGVLKLLREMEPYYPRLAAIMALPRSEYESQAKQFMGEVENSSNPLLSLDFPAFDKCRKKEFSVLAHLAMVRAAVEYKLHGVEGLRAVSDPVGNGPFKFRRFTLNGVDRGFQLTSSYSGLGYPETLIFVDKLGSPFFIEGAQAGQPALK
jgi:hypothetical protein